MSVTRRTFLQASLSGGAALTAFGFDAAPLHAQAKTLKIERTSETRSTCPYCAVSCGVIIHTLGDKAKNVVSQVVHVEGDPDHPINRGTLCPKGASLEQEIASPRRLLKPQVRRPGSDHWEDIGWDQAFDEIAQRVKQTPGRDICRKRLEWPDGQSLRGDRLHRRLHRHERVQLPGREDDAQPGGLLHRKPGPGLTRPNGLQFGAHIRTRRDDERLDRHQEHRHDVDHGWQSG
jgi:formate dehydrogenase major subunit